MKKTVLLLLPLLLGCGGQTSSSSTSPSGSSSPSSSSEDDLIPNMAQVILMFGQSNMEGHTYSQYLLNTMGEDKAKEYVNGYEDVLISYSCTVDNNTSNGEFVPVKAGQGYSLDRFGPEVGMAETLSSAELQAPVFLIKFAQGATSLLRSWRSPSSGLTGGLYTMAVEYVNSALSNLEDMGYYPEVKCICWMQGEDDSNSGQADQYFDLEKNFIKDLREEFSYYMDPDGIGFIDAGISDCLEWKEYKVINEAKMQVCALDPELNIYIDTIGNGLKYNAEPPGMVDVYHFDSSSMIELGHLFAEAALANFLD